MRRRAITAVVAAVVMALTLAGCASIPDRSSPQPIRSLPREQAASQVPTPTAGMEPEALVRGFFKAAADPASRHLAARQFLTQGASNSWDDQGKAVIVDSINVLRSTSTENRIDVNVLADLVGELQPNGQLLPVSGQLNVDMTLVMVDGQWRLDGQLPPGTVIDRAQFLRSYQPRTLYFLSVASGRLVPDPRWLYLGSSQLPDQLLTQLFSGPAADLAGAAASAAPPGTGLRGLTERLGSGGVGINITGIAELPAPDRERLAAQIIWTLSNNGVVGPYRIDADDAPMSDQHADGWTIADVADSDPDHIINTGRGLLAVRSGHLGTVADQFTPVPGALGTTTGILSAAVSGDGTRVAAVMKNVTPGPNGFMLAVANFGAPQTPKVLDGRGIARPSFDTDGSVWTVVDDTIVRVTFPPNGGNPTVLPVGGRATVRSSAEGVVTEAQISPDGARLALIVGGRVLIAAVARLASGDVELRAARALAPNLGAPATSIVWINSSTIFASRDTDDSPLVRIPIDGSPATNLPIANLTAPIRAVAGNSAELLAADNRGVLRLPITDGEPSPFWAEVGPLMGSQAVPVVSP